MNHLIPLISFFVLAVGCSKAPVDAPSTVETAPATQDTVATTEEQVSANWEGIYVSTNEIAGYSGTAISIGPLNKGQREYRKHFYSCISSDEKELPPVIRTNEDELTITERYEFRLSDGTIDDPLEHTTRYTRMKINNQIVLLRDDALKQFKLENKLYDYGVLVKISDVHDSIEDLSKAPHPSIRTLYENPSAGWNDPFVNGANPRK